MMTTTCPRPPRTCPATPCPTRAEGKPTPKAQRNFTDADSRIMKKGASFEQAYNAQALSGTGVTDRVRVGQTDRYF